MCLEPALIVMIFTPWITIDLKIPYFHVLRTLWSLINCKKVIMEGSRDTIIEKCTSEHTTQILDIVIQQPIQFVRICGDTHRYLNCNLSFHNITRAIQDLMWSLCFEEKISRFMQTICHVALLLNKSTNTNHVISYCFRHCFAFINPC
ncbi:unnamed protein product [Brassica rapa]|nr:unnamed protein product [Brassica rapa]